MKEQHRYDELHGTLLNRNEIDTERKYFVIECEFGKFYKLMFSHGWNLISDKPCERNGLKGFEVVIRRSKNNPSK